MYYKSTVEGVVRVDPKLFGQDLNPAVFKQLRNDYEGKVINQLGRVLAILELVKIGDGIIISGDGGAYYRVTFIAINFLPEINEIIEGEIKDIAKFGAFIDFGPFEGMVHLSQTMDDFVTFSKTGTLQGKDSQKVLKVGDKVRARIVAISMRDLEDPKLGLTMRQPYLGKLDWIEDQIKREQIAAKKAAAAEK